MKQIKMYGFFDIREEHDKFRMEVFKKHSHLQNEVEALEKSDEWNKKNKALALKEIILKIRIDPNELNSKYLVEKLDVILGAKE